MKYFASLLVFLFLLSCQTMQLPMQTGETLKVKSIEDYFKKSTTLNSYFVGFGLYDIEK